MKQRAVLLIATLAVLAAACGDDGEVAQTDTDVVATTEAPATTAAEAEVEPSTEETDTAESESDDPATDSATTGETITVVAEVWADNWFSLTVNGSFVGEDSVPITTDAPSTPRRSPSTRPCR